jgi:hypothetical protein
MNIDDKMRWQLAEQMSDFYNGAYSLEKLSAWAYVVANQQMIIEHLALFERAYAELLRLHAAGRLGAGAADFSEEHLESVKRINELIRQGLDRREVHDAAQEVQALAEQCLQRLKQGKP